MRTLLIALLLASCTDSVSSSEQPLCMPATNAELRLDPPRTNAFTNVVLRAREAGAIGNALVVEFRDTGTVNAGVLEERWPHIQVRYKPAALINGVYTPGTTTGDVQALFAMAELAEFTIDTSGYRDPSLAFLPTIELQDHEDAFEPTSMSGGDDPQCL